MNSNTTVKTDNSSTCLETSFFLCYALLNQIKLYYLKIRKINYNKNNDKLIIKNDAISVGTIYEQTIQRACNCTQKQRLY